jgi:hypothetical protein
MQSPVTTRRSLRLVVAVTMSSAPNSGSAVIAAVKKSRPDAAILDIGLTVERTSRGYDVAFRRQCDDFARGALRPSETLY